MPENSCDCSQRGVLWDSVQYDDDPPWPGEPDGEGPTLELIDPNLDNALPQSWAASVGYGTPGEMNSMSNTEGVSEGVGPALTLGLQRPVPNPLSTQTKIGFSLDRRRHVRVSIHDVIGRRIALLAAGEFPAGIHNLSWSGCNDAGHMVSAGLYLILMDSEGFADSRKLLLLR